uniref:Glucokinase regulator n=1 Tax=Cyprinodon variegatus TaxID=28743 RepID=A0A3Q2DH78_CYPVA
VVGVRRSEEMYQTPQSALSTGYEPVSEMSNPITREIDRAPASSIVKMLHACDIQMFQEESGLAYEKLLSNQVVETLMKVAERVQLILEDSLIVLSGCGTSGRLAFFITVKITFLGGAICLYIIAGGDRLLFVFRHINTSDRMVLIGAPHQAPFVAGQLDVCLQHPDVYTPVLIGFNPCVSLCRKEPIPGCTFTFHSVVERMQELSKMQKAFLINPALGPEAISGSSRMKGGSATKILLEVVFSAAHAANSSRTPILYKYRMKSYKQALDVTYSQAEGIAALMEAAGHRRVCYLGWGSLGLLGLIDASECKPTFGQWELSTKLLLNAVSTGAHIFKGKVYQNYMIDLQVTNSKLYHRATRLLQSHSVRKEAVEECLLKYTSSKGLEILKPNV